MKNYIAIISCLFFANIHAQNINVSGAINTNTVWDAISIDTVKVIGDLNLDDGVSLTITPGIVVDFTDDYYFNIDGNLFASGTALDSIQFMTSDTTGYSTNTHHGWSGLRFVSEGNDSSRIEYTSIRYGKADGSIPVTNSNYGGAIYLSQSNKVYLSHLSIRNNFASALGGGIYSFNSHPTSVTDNPMMDSEFKHNTANDAGGAFYSDNDFTLTFDGCTFLYNEVLGVNAPRSGGAIASNSPGQGNQPDIFRSRFGHNIAKLGSRGGALYFFYAGEPGMISQCIFHNNQASQGGAIYCSYRLEIQNSILVNNSADYGGAIFSSNGNQFNWKLRNTTIANNEALLGGGLCIENGIGFSDQYLFPYKTIFSNNASTTAGVNEDFYLLNVQSNHTIRFDGCSLTGDLTNCNQGGSTVSEIQSLMFTDPEFINPSTGIGASFDGYTGRNWDVNQCTSPCIDGAYPSFPAYATDYDGDPRIVNDSIDIGAYESYGFLTHPQDLEICEGDSSIFGSDYFYPGINLSNSYWHISFDNGINWFAVETYTGDFLLSANTDITNDGMLVRLNHDFGCGTAYSNSALLTVNPNVVTPQDITLCDDSLYLQGGWQTTSGTYYDTLQTSLGCDSIIQTNLTIGSSFYAANTLQFCSGDSMLVYGNYVSAAGNYYDSLLTVNGCDSVYMTAVTLNPIYSIINDYTICANDSVFVGGAWQQTTGTYYDYFSTVNGCDSTIISNLVINPVSFSTIDTSFCEGQSVVINGATLDQAGSFEQLLTNAYGCDSTLTINVIEHPLPNATIGPDTLFICDGDLLAFGIDTTGIASYSISNFSTTVYDDSLIFNYDQFAGMTSVVSSVTSNFGCVSSDQVILESNNIQWMSANFPTINDPSVDFSIANMPTNVDFWYWSFGDGDTLSGDPNPTHVYTSNGNFDACLIAVNACGADSSCFNFDISTTGVSALEQGAILIYPNPGTGIFHISSELTEMTTIKVINLLGEELKNIQLLPNQDTFSLEEFPVGQYILRVESAGIQLIQKITLMSN